jgi:transcriptional regulator with XRE-family HTH domain
MKERLLEFLRAENKSSAQLAEEIGVQPSGISHILSGRNNPSLDFIMKMLEKYQFISTDWLLFGKGSMYKDLKMQTLFDDNNNPAVKIESKSPENEVDKSEFKFLNISDRDPKTVSSETKKNNTSEVARIVWFYDDNSFEEYFPRH